VVSITHPNTSSIYWSFLRPQHPHSGGICRFGTVAILNPFFEALIIHLAEGTDEAAKEEFTFVSNVKLLNPKGVIIHGIPLTKQDFTYMATNGTGLVWSPRSNIELYGKTADVIAALKAGVEVALAPDWAITGNSNMLRYLFFCVGENHEKVC
jgi:hypothetical protein